MNGSQCNAIEARRKVIEEVVVRDARKISALIALETLIRLKGETEYQSEAVSYINKEADRIIEERKQK